MEKAKAHVEAEEYEKALALLEQIVKAKPKPPPVFKEADDMLPKVRLQKIRQESEKRKAEEAAAKAAEGTGHCRCIN